MIPLPLDLDWDQKFQSIAQKVEGFSGREVAKLTIAWQVRYDILFHFFLSSSCVLSYGRRLPMDLQKVNSPKK